MPNVGRPNNNPARMEPRSVPVEKDKPRINDERKVRPHSAGEPPMGVRPSHPGAQKEPVAPPDSLNAEYIQARDVSMATMTETELAEWNPFARRAQSGPSLEELSAKISKLEAGMARMHQDRNQMVMQISQLMRSVNPNTPGTPTPSGHPLRRQMGMSSPTPQNEPQGAGPKDWSVDAPSGAVKTPMGKKPEWSASPQPQRVDPDLNKLRQRVRSGEGSSSMSPEAPVATPGRSETQGTELTQEQRLRFIKLQNPEKYNDISVKSMTPYQIDKAYERAVNMQTRGKRMREGYPDKSFERTEPAHSSRIGDLKWKGKAHEPKPPRDNRDFMQARDVSVERVHENADNEMNDLIAQTLNRMGLDEIFLPDDNFTGSPRATKAGGSELKGDADKMDHKKSAEHTGRDVTRGPASAAPVSETKLPRARARW